VTISGSHDFRAKLLYSKNHKSNVTLKKKQYLSIMSCFILIQTLFLKTMLCALFEAECVEGLTV
jgi:hypothetical protein